ncbi:hypothetical protein MRB53_020277 [Persea americana]|uniref:Uncharacterized protein n=1 Tax=Persea americana TaxID=3435 RepID=A0ACC2L0L0_PERAE|nr:hypothetical protein MRB53_020277 [Persea americana]
MTSSPSTQCGQLRRKELRHLRRRNLMAKQSKRSSLTQMAMAWKQGIGNLHNNEKSLDMIMMTGELIIYPFVEGKNDCDCGFTNPDMTPGTITSCPDTPFSRVSFVAYLPRAQTTNINRSFISTLLLCFRQTLHVPIPVVDRAYNPGESSAHISSEKRSQAPECQIPATDHLSKACSFAAGQSLGVYTSEIVCLGTLVLR